MEDLQICKKGIVQFDQRSLLAALEEAIELVSGLRQVAMSTFWKLRIDHPIWKETLQMVGDIEASFVFAAKDCEPKDHPIIARGSFHANLDHVIER